MTCDPSVGNNRTFKKEQKVKLHTNMEFCFQVRHDVPEFVHGFPLWLAHKIEPYRLDPDQVVPIIRLMWNTRAFFFKTRRLVLTAIWRIDLALCQYHNHVVQEYDRAMRARHHK